MIIDAIVRARVKTLKVVNVIFIISIGLVNTSALDAMKNAPIFSIESGKNLKYKNIYLC